VSKWLQVQRKERKVGLGHPHCLRVGTQTPNRGTNGRNDIGKRGTIGYVELHVRARIGMRPRLHKRDLSVEELPESRFQGTCTRGGGWADTDR